MKEKLKTFQKEQEGKLLKEGIKKLKRGKKDIMTVEIEIGRGPNVFMDGHEHINSYCSLLSASFVNIYYDCLSDTENSERSIRRTGVRFHDVCDSGISITNHYTTATNTELNTGGVCFMNQPMKFGEEVHIRGIHTSLELKQKAILEIGLTNINPEKIRFSENKKINLKASKSAFKEVNCIPDNNEGKSECFHLCISLLRKNSFECTLDMCLNEDQHVELCYKKPSIHDHLWLAIDLHGIKLIMISTN